MKGIHMRPRGDCPPGNVYLTAELARNGHPRAVVTYHPTTTAKLAFASARRLAEEGLYGAEIIAELETNGAWEIRSIHAQESS